MVRQYDSKGRKNAAKQTRQRILQAALKLHWEGVTEYEPLAQEAGCSLPTLRKHFPTKEALFQSCTKTFAETQVMPDLSALARIPAPEQRLKESITALCNIHESMFGYAWLSARLRKDSPTLDSEMHSYDKLVDAVTEIIAPKAQTKTPVIRGFLDFLTYRALRLSAKLSPDDASEELINVISLLVLDQSSTGKSITLRENNQP